MTLRMVLRELECALESRLMNRRMNEQIQTMKENIEKERAARAFLVRNTVPTLGGETKHECWFRQHGGSGGKV